MRGLASSAEIEAELERLDRVSKLLDTSFRFPGTSFRFGLDALVGLIPGVGDLAGAGLSAWLVLRAHRLGARRRSIARMLGAIGLEALVGTVPVAGDVFDAWFKSNRRVVRLLKRDLERQRAGLPDDAITRA